MSWSSWFACALAVVAITTVPTNARQLPSGPLIVGYGTRCDGKSEVGDDAMVAEATRGVNVIVWFTTDLVLNTTTGEPVVRGGPNATCVALVARELQRRGLPTAHMISIGGWDAPHPDTTTLSGAAWWRIWRKWNVRHVSRLELGFEGYDGIDWDLEGNDNAASRWNIFSLACLNLVGEMSVAAKRDGFLVSLVPPQSYLDVSTRRFSRSVALSYDDWHPEFQYRGANVYAYWIAKYNVETFDFVDIQLYETYSRACEAVNGKGERPRDYLTRWIGKVQAGWEVDFSTDPALHMPAVNVSVPASRLVVGLSRGGTNGRSVYIPPSEVAAAYGLLSPARRPRGLMFWNMANDRGPVNGSATDTCDFAAEFNAILNVRPETQRPMTPA